MTQPQQPQFDVELPEDLVAGVYSNVVGVWYTPYEFTLDFAAISPVQWETDEPGQSVSVVPARVVSRVKIPPSAVFELMRNLSETEARYIKRIGPIRKPGPEPDASLYPPES